MLINHENQKMETTIRTYLLVMIAVAFLVTFYGVSVIQVIYERIYYYSLLSGHVSDIMADSTDDFEKILSGWTETFIGRIEKSRGVADNDYLADQVYSNEEYLSELDIVDENGIVVYSSNPDMVGFDMHSNSKAAEFLCLLSGTDYYAVEELIPSFSDPNYRMSYSGRPFSDGNRFILMGIDETDRDTIIDEDNADEVRHRHIGVNGSVLICNRDGSVAASAYQTYDGKFLDNMKILPDEEGEFKHTKAKLFNEICYIVAVRSEDGYIVGMIPTKEAESFSTLNRLMFVAMNIVIFVCMFLFLSKLLNRHVVREIERIDESLEKITAGDLDERLDVKSSLEFKKLSSGINTMVDRLKSMIEQEKARIDGELEQAMTIQTSSLPSVFPPYPDRNEFEIFATMNAAKVVGGDFYDFYMTDDDHLVMVVADVSGKGIPAALFMMSAKTIIRSMSQANKDPSKILIRSNAALSEDNKEDMFVTVWLGILTISTGKLTYASAGHTAAVFYQEGSWNFSEHHHNGAALGLYEPDELDFLPEKYRITDRNVILKEGDAVFLYTDGLTEAHNIDNEMYGTQKLLETLSETGDANPEGLLKAIRSSVDEFVNDAPQFDDITMLGLIYRGKNTKETEEA